MLTRATFSLFISLSLGVGLNAATIIDLTTEGATSTKTADSGGTFIVTQVDPQSTGTGVIDSFLRIQQTGEERGYNTSVSNPPLDDKAGNFTRSLLLSEIPTVNIGGIDYLQFLLDVNQANEERLSLNQIQIFQSAGDPGKATYSLTEATATQNAIISGLGTSVFRMSNQLVSSGTAYEVQLDYSLNAGSGSGDMFLYVQKSNFVAANGANVVLFSQFGAPPGTYSSNDGFEEWSVVKSTGAICVGDCTINAPEPNTIILAGTMLLGLTQLMRRRLSRRS